MYRLLIADDQSIECKALEHKIREEFSDIELLPSVQDGISLLKEVERLRPDIAIVDINMPGLTGLESIELLRKKKIDIKIIIHTGYSEFLYAQKALKLGAVNYLLKPCDKEEMMETVRNVCRILDEERRIVEERKQNRADVHELADSLAKGWIQSLLLHQKDTESDAQLQRFCPESAWGGVFIAWRLLGDAQQDIAVSILRETESLILGHLRQFCKCFGIWYKDIFYVAAFPGKENMEEPESWFQDIIHHVCQKLKVSGIFTRVGVSRWKKSAEELESGLYESRIALQGREKPGIYFFNRGKSMRRPLELADKMPLVINYLSEGNTEAGITVLQNALYAESIDSEDDFFCIKIRLLEFMLELNEEWKLLCKAPGLGIVPYIFDEKLPAAKNREELLSWLESCLQAGHKLQEETESPGNIYVMKAVLFMSQNYGCDISLEDVGKEIGISSFYLSRLLKQEKKLTFSELLTDIRMAVSVGLIKEGQLSVNDISRRVGYANVSYFYKIFKKCTGLTVGIARRFLE